MTQQIQQNLLSLQVNADDIVAFLKQQTQYQAVFEQVLYQRLIDWYAHDRGIQVTSEETQIAGNQFRQAHNLEKAEDTLAWLAIQKITPEDWEQGLHHNLLTQKLAQHLFHDQIEKYFAENRLNYDRVILYEILLPDVAFAEELFYQIDENEISVYEAAHLYDRRPDSRYRCGFVGHVCRWDVAARFSAEIFAAQPQQVLPPMQSDAGYHLFWVEDVLPAQLTPELAQIILRQLLQEWLDRELTYFKHQ
jgi:parvulin-like peptidyl-prolyl isomerase